MIDEKPQKAFNSRAFVSSAMIISFLFLPASGIMMHELQSEVLTIQRHFWMSVHNISALLFTVFALFHIKYNWKPLVNHFHKIKGAVLSKEAVSAILLVAGILFLFSTHAFRMR